MLRQQTPPYTGEVKRDDETELATTPVHDMRAAEPTLAPTGAERAVSKVDGSKSGTAEGVEEEEKPTWEEVIMQSTADDSYSLLPQATDESEPLSAQQKTIIFFDSSEDRACISTRQINNDTNAASDEILALHQSRLDALEASLDAKLESGFASVAESVSHSIAEQNRVVNKRLGDLEEMIQRLEGMMQRGSGIRPAA